MKRFAKNNTTFETKVEELTQIKMLSDDWEKKQAKEILLDYLFMCFPEVNSVSAKRGKISTLRVLNGNALEYFDDSTTEVTQAVFVEVVLQLLGYLEDGEWEIEKASQSISLLAKFDCQSETIIEKRELIDALYQLLFTHGADGLMLIDRLASKGFFQNYANTPLFLNGKAMPVFDTTNLIREVVYVETDEDTDGDGWADLVKVEVIRPRADQLIPALFTASPYNQGVNERANDKKLHNVKIAVPRKEVGSTLDDHSKNEDRVIPVKKREITHETTEADETFTREMNYSLNDHFLSRGFAAVYSTGIGGKESEGLMPCGEKEQVDSFKAVVEWLNGKRNAFTNKVDRVKINAHWCNGKVAMTGKSYLGTMATAVATTGVEGLETIVSEAAISNWYNYYRENGLVIAPGGFQGEDCDVLAELTYSRMIQAGDYVHSKAIFEKRQKELSEMQDRETGNYNRFWENINYIRQVSSIKCDCILVHGLNDWNVKPKHVYELWQELQKSDVTKKLILHQGEHIYINNNRSLDFTDMMNAWFSHKLYGVNNDANTVLPDILWQENSVAETWTPVNSWGDTERNEKFSLKEMHSTKEDTVSFADSYADEEREKYSKAKGSFSQEVLKEESAALKGKRLYFTTETFEKENVINGVPKVKLRVKASQNVGFLTVRLVDLGEAKRLKVAPTTFSIKIDHGFGFREENLREIELDTETTQHKMISIGHLHLQNRTNPWTNEEFHADEYVDCEIEMQPILYRLPKGRKLGLVVYATDFDFTFTKNMEEIYTIDTANSTLVIPIGKEEENE